MYAPEEYYALTPEDKASICNGTGPGSWKPFTTWIPLNSLAGLDITECSNIHDYMYYVGGDDNDKNFADKVYNNNLNGLIDETPGNFFINTFRRSVAYTYYSFVMIFGHNFFNYNHQLRNK